MKYLQTFKRYLSHNHNVDVSCSIYASMTFIWAQKRKSRLREGNILCLDITGKPQLGEEGCSHTTMELISLSAVTFNVAAQIILQKSKLSAVWSPCGAAVA